MERVLVLAAQKWAFTDEKSGERRDGVTIRYVTPDPDDTPERKGIWPLKVTCGLEIWALLGALPALCDVKFKQKPDKDGKPTLTVVGIRFLEAFPLDMLEPA